MLRRIAALVLASLAVAVVFLPRSRATAGAESRVIGIMASQYAFDPGEITVMAGERVDLALTSVDVVHGLYLDGYEMSVSSDPGQTSHLEFVADRTGTYTFRCSVSCGSLHPFMVGKLRVIPDGKWGRLLGGGILALAAGVIWAGGRVKTDAEEA